MKQQMWQSAGLGNTASDDYNMRVYAVDDRAAQRLMEWLICPAVPVNTIIALEAPLESCPLQ